MAEYIEREAAIRALQPTHAPAINEVLASVIRRVPAADVAPVRHGRWEWDRLHEAYRCSCCDNYNADRTAYCPNCGANCGAKMDGGQDDGSDQEPPKEET